MSGCWPFRPASKLYPLLQLDIVAGTYDPVTQTTIAGGPDFTLIALLTPKATDNLATLLDTYYISAALMPRWVRRTPTSAASPGTARTSMRPAT